MKINEFNKIIKSFFILFEKNPIKNSNNKI